MIGRTARRILVVSAALVGLAGCGVDPPNAVVGVRARGCTLVPELGSGLVVDDGLVLTSAHPLRGAREIEIERDGVLVPAHIVGFDPEMDLAYLAADGLVATTLPVRSDHVERGDVGSAWVFRDGAAVRLDVTVRRRLTINTEDIYVEGETSRPGYELTADIRPGDSGGAVIVDGAVVGVVWARSRRFPGRSYAIDPDRAGERIATQLRTGDLGDDVDLTRCS